jgi:hypothetical protein
LSIAEAHEAQAELLRRGTAESWPDWQFAGLDVAL